jgi:hypothetical protein
MDKTSVHRAALLGSASALGLNWIYDRKLLQKHKDEGNMMIFESIDHELYKSAKNAYDVYPNHRLGDLDFMGEVYYLLYMFLEYEKEQHLDRFREIFYEYFREDFEYDGYIESYGKAFLKQYHDEKEGVSDVQEYTSHVDKQLVGLIFILAMYQYEGSMNKVQDAVHYAKTLTAYENIKPLSEMLYHLLADLDAGVEKHTAIKNAVGFAPEQYRNALMESLTNQSVDAFLSEYAGIACGIDQALPLILYIVAHSTTWQDAMVLNATLGGASSARGIFISAIMSRFVEIPDEYLFKLNYHVR